MLRSMRRMSMVSLPRPKIIDRSGRLQSAGGAAGALHQRLHAHDRRVKAREDRLADREMADIQLDDLGDLGNWADRIEGKPVAGMNLEAQAVGQSGALD